jgi:hypothetical protein
MDNLIGRLVAGCRGRVMPLALGVALAGCAGENPASPSIGDSEGPQLERADQTAAARFPISVTPRSVRVDCSLNTSCTTSVTLSATGAAVFSWSVADEFTVNFGATTCGGTLDNSSCVIGLIVDTSGEPGRRTGVLTIELAGGGPTKTYRLTARVS